VKSAIAIIDRAFEHGPAALACSGGTDSMILLDLIFAHTDHRPPVVYLDNGLDYRETRQFLIEACAHYGASLHVAEPRREPKIQWERQGWPMLGKINANKWTARHPDAGFRLNCSACCQVLKIKPARDLTKSLGCKVQLTGNRGGAEARIRGRWMLEDAIRWNKQDKLWIAAPLCGWTNLGVNIYTRQHGLRQHPARRRGAESIGCIPCGGGCQWDNSGFKFMRKIEPALWHKYMVDWRMGEIVLAIKHDKPLALVQEAVGKLGGLESLAETQPWIFDCTLKTPLKGTAK